MSTGGDRNAWLKFMGWRVFVEKRCHRVSLSEFDETYGIRVPVLVWAGRNESPYRRFTMDARHIMGLRGLLMGVCSRAPERFEISE